MTRVKRGITKNLKREIILNQAKSYKGISSLLIRTAKQRTLKAETHAYKDRRAKRRQWGLLWVTRINGILRNNGIHWSIFSFFLKNTRLTLNRQILSQIGLQDYRTFQTYFLYLVNTLCRI